MARLLAALSAGLLFGAGLLASDMVNPARVLAFLDLAGDWDPTLAFVIGGALIPTVIAFAIARHMGHPVLEPGFHLPSRRDLDAPLIGGALLFGIGWGLVGFCPGPAIAVLAFGPWQGAVFVAAVLAGMILHRLWPEPNSPSAAAKASRHVS